MDPVRDPCVDYRQHPGNEVVERDQRKTEIDGAQHFRAEHGLGETAQDTEADVSGQVNRDHWRDAAQVRRDERRDIRRARRSGGRGDASLEDCNRHGCPRSSELAVLEIFSLERSGAEHLAIGRLNQYGDALAVSGRLDGEAERRPVPAAERSQHFHPVGVL